MKCYKCGKYIPDDSTFCNMCGARLEILKNESVDKRAAQDKTFADYEDLSSNDAPDCKEAFTDTADGEQQQPDDTASETTVCGAEEVYSSRTEDNPYFTNSTDNPENYEINADISAKPKKKYTAAIVLSVGLIVAAIAIASSLFFLSHGDIDGTWVQDIESADIFGVMNQTIIEFDDDGEMTYVSGFYLQKDWTYSYNRFLGILKMTRGSDDQKQVIITKIKWLDRDTFAMTLNGTVFVRTNQDLDDMGYDTGDDDIVKF